MWYPAEEPWQYRVLDALPPSVDMAQLEAAARMTPHQRVLALIQLMKPVEELQRARKKTEP